MCSFASKKIMYFKKMKSKPKESKSMKNSSIQEEKEKIFMFFQKSADALAQFKKIRRIKEASVFINKQERNRNTKNKWNISEKGNKTVV